MGTSVQLLHLEPRTLFRIFLGNPGFVGTQALSPLTHWPHFWPNPEHPKPGKAVEGEPHWVILD